MSHLTALLGCLILSFLTTCGEWVFIPVTHIPSFTVWQLQSGHPLLSTGLLALDPFIERQGGVPRPGTEEPCRHRGMSHLTALLGCLILSFLTTCGIYICKVSVEIPILQQTEGNGTQLTVQSAVDSSSTEPLMSIPVTAVLILLLLATGGLCLCAVLWHRIKKKLMPYPGQASGRVGMVIHEEPHEDVEELEERREKAVAADETSSSSSRGSTEWRAVQVYESFDYFAVQNSKDG
ncbi:hypothetical protein AAFF_G00108310 [Aldrovandia affinis]|uniref:Uncharacterized protein n=1 Tax=Aldrovandia affinis TaxID=143900 RepID=A0AAD7RU20_9TELE|nr:hypothetical protein AAFF_G00108310 [Aldrovandia affinis]